MAAHYDNYNYVQYWTNRDYEHESEAIAINSFFENTIGKVKTVADIGCGFGRLFPLYEPYSRETFLIEPSKKLLSTAKEMMKHKKHITFSQSTVEKLNGELSPVDVLLFIRVMHHLKDPYISLKRISEHIKPGGYLILEFANKLHAKAQIKNLFAGNILYPFEIFPEDKRSKNNKNEACIPFFNYHPDIIFSYLKSLGFEVVETRSVSNIRSRRLKRLIPTSLLIHLERELQKPLASIHFGPSIFVLAHKKAG